MTLAKHTSIDLANKRMLARTAAKIDRLLKAQDRDTMSTEDMLDEMAHLRDCIKTHLEPQKPFDKQSPRPVIIRVDSGRASIAAQTTDVAVLIIDFDAIKQDGNTDAAIELVEDLQRTPLPKKQRQSLIKQLTKAAQQTCARCEKPIPLGRDESTPSGSMHKGCAAEYEDQQPEDF